MLYIFERKELRTTTGESSKETLLACEENDTLIVPRIIVILIYYSVKNGLREGANNVLCRASSGPGEKILTATTNPGQFQMKWNTAPRATNELC